MTVFFSLTPATCFSQAPDIEWQKTFGGSSYDEAEKIIQTRDGGYIMAGWTFSNDGDANGNHAPGDGDCWIIKMDPTGNIQWKKMIGGTKYEDALTIKETKDGGYIIGGHTTSDDGDLTGHYGDFMPDAIVIKLDQAGNIEWVKNFGGADYDAILSIDETQDGGYIFAGYTGSNDMDVSGNHGDYDAWIVKLDNNGNIQWRKCIGGTARDNAWSITSSPDGGYVFTGHTTSTDGDIAVNHGQWDILTGKLDAAGNIQWIKTMGGSLMEWSLGIVPASDGGYVIAGYAFSGNGDVTTSYGLNDFWIIKIDGQGNMQWEKSYGGSDFEDPYFIDPTSDGGYVVAGRTRSVNGHVSSSYGNNDYWILKLDVTGNLQWEKSIGGTQQDVAHSIQQTSDGGFIIAGTSYSSDGDVTANRGQSDAWVVKLGVCTLNTPDIPGTITGNTAPCTGTPISYSMDPVNEATGYTWTFPAGWTIVSGQGTTAITVLPGNPGEISVVAYNSCKRSEENKLTVTPINSVAPQITVKPNAGNNICQGTEIVFTANTIGAIAPIYQWKKNGTSVGANANIYRDKTLKNGDVVSCELTSTSNCGNQSVVVSQAITMSVSPLARPAISISSNATSICKGAEVIFTGTSTDQGPNPIYRWYVNNVNVGSNLPSFSSHSLSDGDVIYCQLVSSEACAVSPMAESNQITIIVDTNTAASATITSTATTICKNDEVTFHAEAGNAGTSPTYHWTINGVAAGSNTGVFIAGNLSDKDRVACTVAPGLNTCAVNAALSNTIQIIINPLPQLMVYPDDTLVNPGTHVTFDTWLSEDIRSFNWTPAGMLQVPSLLEPTTVPIITPVTYRLAIITKDGCSMYKDVTIKPLIPLYMPNAFTPNGDGLNDLFRIPPGSDLILTDLSIYNIWGEKIFLTTDINSGWDGRVKGVDQSSGVFVYKISGFQNNRRVFLKGTFTLIR